MTSIHTASTSTSTSSSSTVPLSTKASSSSSTSLSYLMSEDNSNAGQVLSSYPPQQSLPPFQYYQQQQPPQPDNRPFPGLIKMEPQQLPIPPHLALPTLSDSAQQPQQQQNDPFQQYRVAPPTTQQQQQQSSVPSLQHPDSNTFRPMIHQQNANETYQQSPHHQHNHNHQQQQQQQQQQQPPQQLQQLQQQQHTPVSIQSSSTSTTAASAPALPLFPYPNPTRTTPVQQLPPTSQALYSQYSTSPQYTPNSPQRKVPFFPFPYHSRSQSESLTSLDSADWSGISQDRKRMRRVYDVTDQELLELARKSVEITLDELALPVTMAENKVDEVSKNNSKHSREIRIAESDKKKQHQIFAMVILMRSVEADETAVCPRNRIFGKYVSLCKENGVTPLCNASFGKLVKLVFPNLTTRRLGTRGYSRYHYCGIKLIDDQDYEEELPMESPTATTVTGMSISSQGSGSNASGGTQLQPQQQQQQQHQQHDPQDTLLARNLDEHLSPLLREQTHEFVPPSIEAFIHQFPSEDQNAAKTISVSYSEFCKDTFYCIRYMQVKSLLEGLTKYRFSQSNEAVKILAQPQVASWIHECDTKLYKAFIKLLTKVAIQSVPENVVFQISNLVGRLLDTINEMNIPEHIRISKLQSAEKFVRVCQRLVRLMKLSSGLAKNLSDPLLRSRMMEGWLRVDMRQIMERDLVLPEHVKPVAVNILCSDIPKMFQLLQGASEEVVIQSIIKSVSPIPLRIPSLSAKTFLTCITTVCNEVNQELFISNISEFHSWYGLSCWITEFFSYLVQLSHYLRDDITR